MLTPLSLLLPPSSTKGIFYAQKNIHAQKQIASSNYPPTHQTCK